MLRTDPLLSEVVRLVKEPVSPQTEVAVFAANDEYEPSLLDIMAAAEAYRAERERLVIAARDVVRDEKHWRESVERMREAEADMKRAREALLRATGAVPESQLAQEV
jgi:hypothetical protein